MSNLKEKAKLNRKKLLSAAVIAVCGIAGLGYACMTNSPKENITIADKGKYISSDTGSREITNEMYDFNKVSSHKIIQSAVSLEESDSVKSLGNNMYMVPSDYTDENITETYSDDVITVSGNAADTEIKNEYDSQESALKKYLDGENTTGNDLRVAVIDSGISGYGTDNRILKGANFSATGGDDFSDDNGHGNVMAGIISEMTADNVNLMPVKVIDSSGRGTVASLYKGIEYAVEQNVDVINLSVTTALSDNGLIKKAVKDAVNAGITVVAAAGNYGTNADYYSPANISEVITVSSVDNDLNPSEFTNYGSCIDYAAIGETEKASGTSVSAAKVTGIVSLLKGVDKTYSTNDIETILDKYAVNTGKNSQYTGRGILALENVNTNKVEEKKIEDKKEQYEPLIEKIKRETKKKYKNWNELSADDLNELIKNDTEDHIAYFWQGLNDAEKVDVLKKSHYLNQDISVFDSETNESAEMSYAKHLENDFNFKDEVYTSNWRDFKLWDSNSGFYYLRYTGDATGYYRVSITIDSNSAHTGRYHLSVAFHSGTDIYNSFKINNPEGTTEGDNYYIGATTFTMTLAKKGYSAITATAMGPIDLPYAGFTSSTKPNWYAPMYNNPDCQKVGWYSAGDHATWTFENNEKHIWSLTCNPNGGTLVGGNFSTNAGTSNSHTVKVTAQQTYYYALGTAKKDGYTFLGWYTDPEGGTQVYNSNGYFVVGDYWNFKNQWQYAGNLTIYAHWKLANRDVTINPNGGVILGLHDDMTEKLSCQIGSNVDVSKTFLQDKNFTMERPGYTFKGWSTDANASSGDTTYKVPNDDSILYAIWELKSGEQPQFINMKSGAIKVSYADYDMSVEKITAIDKPAKTDNIFDRYDDASNYKYISSNGVLPGSDTFSQDTTLFAKFTNSPVPASQVSLTYIGANGAIKTETYDKNTEVTVNPPDGLDMNQTGRNFSKWYETVGTDVSKTYNNGDKFTITADTVLEARWTAADCNIALKYFIRDIQSDNYTHIASKDKTIVKTYGTKVSSFINDYIDNIEGCHYVQYEADSQAVVNNMTINLYYDRNSYVLHLTADEGIDPKSLGISKEDAETKKSIDFNYEYGADVTTSAEEEIGYRWRGWTTSQDAASLEKELGIDLSKMKLKLNMPAHDVYLTATAQKGNYKLTVIPREKSDTENIRTSTVYWNDSDKEETEKGSAFKQGASKEIYLDFKENRIINTPVRNGYDFAYWEITDSEGNIQTGDTAAVMNSKIFTMGAKDTVITAHWTPRNDTAYKVYHWVQKPTGNPDILDSNNYELRKEWSNTYYGTSDTFVTPDVYTEDGLKTPVSQTKNINANGTTRFDFYYTRYGLTINYNAGVSDTGKKAGFKNIPQKGTDGMYYKTDENGLILTSSSANGNFVPLQTTLVYGNDVMDVKSADKMKLYLRGYELSDIESWINDYYQIYISSKPNGNSGQIEKIKKLIANGNMQVTVTANWNPKTYHINIDPRRLNPDSAENALSRDTTEDNLNSDGTILIHEVYDHGFYSGKGQCLDSELITNLPAIAKREGFDLEGYFNIKKPETDNSEADNNSVKNRKEIITNKGEILISNDYYADDNTNSEDDSVTIYAHWLDNSGPSTDDKDTYLQARTDETINSKVYATATANHEAITRNDNANVLFGTALTTDTWSTQWINKNLMIDFHSMDTGSGIRRLLTKNNTDLEDLSNISKFKDWNDSTFKPTISRKDVSSYITNKNDKIDRTEGSETYYGIATDRSSNLTETKILTTKIDKTAPDGNYTIKTGTLISALNSNYCAGSGTSLQIDETAGTMSVNDDGMRTELKVTVTDKNGNGNATTDVSGVKYVWMNVYDSSKSEDIGITYICHKVSGNKYDGVYIATELRASDMQTLRDSNVEFDKNVDKLPNLYKDFKDASKITAKIYVCDEAGNVRNITGKVTNPKAPELGNKGTWEKKLDPQPETNPQPDPNPDNNKEIIESRNISIYSRIERNDKNSPVNKAGVVYPTVSSDEYGPKFLLGQSGKVRIITYGYVSTVDVEFPKALQEASLLDVARGQSLKLMGTVNKLTGTDSGKAVSPVINLDNIYTANDCTRTYDYDFTVPLYLGDSNISFLNHDIGWTTENLVYKKTKINTVETAHKNNENDISESAFNCGTDKKKPNDPNDDDITKITDRLRTHLIH